MFYTYVSKICTNNKLFPWYKIDDKYPKQISWPKQEIELITTVIHTKSSHHSRIILHSILQSTERLLWYCVPVIEAQIAVPEGRSTQRYLIHGFCRFSLKNIIDRSWHIDKNYLMVISICPSRLYSLLSYLIYYYNWVSFYLHVSVGILQK